MRLCLFFGLYYYFFFYILYSWRLWRRRHTFLWTFMSGHAEDGRVHCTGQTIPILIPARSERQWSASNRKQTPLIADSCPWLMILNQYPKPMFFSFWNVSSVLPWPISLIALCWHQRLAGRTGLMGPGLSVRHAQEDWKTSLMSLIRTSLT